VGPRHEITRRWDLTVEEEKVPALCEHPCKVVQIRGQEGIGERKNQRRGKRSYDVIF